MPIINITTEISAPIQKVFDTSRSVDIHKNSMKHTNERAIAGKTSGLMELNDWVTWEAKHFGITQQLTSKITEFNPPYFFVDEMQKGAFKSFRHEHHFSEENGITTMVDVFEYKSPYGILGRFADWLFLERYMTRLLERRNSMIKSTIEN